MGKYEGYDIIATIIDKKNVDRLISLNKKLEVFSNVVIHCEGTAKSEFLNFLGIESNVKVIVLSFVRESNAIIVMDAIHRVFELDRPGRGIAFSLDIRRTLGLFVLQNIMEQMPQAFHNEVTIDEDIELSSSALQSIPDYIAKDTYELISVITNIEHAKNLMEIAYENGVTGGTLIESGGYEASEQKVFEDIAVTPEKRILLLLVSREKTKTLLNAFTTKGRLNEENMGIAFSTDVKYAVGLSKSKTDINLPL